MPSIEQLQNPKLSQASTIYSADGVEMGKFFTENRQPVDSAAISPWVFKALIATEDKRFNDHSGIDLRRMAGVAAGILSGNLRCRRRKYDFQTACQTFTIPEKEMRGLFYYIPLVKLSYIKQKEWLTAIQLEKRFTKGEIATLYLNTVDYGNNTFGIKTASKTYFNKTPDKLTVSEAAVLVGLQKATTYYNPIRNPKTQKRRNTVLQRLVQNGDLDAKLAANFRKRISNWISIWKMLRRSGQLFESCTFQTNRNWAKKNEIDLDLYRDGLKIYTTIDSRMQGSCRTSHETAHENASERI
ncbi:MAG: transglycosylase domain-containing protein [Cytophagaceae bacterium]|nr:transglycosylase domain-containing protein [Cytophagaceae bacterium]